MIEPTLSKETLNKWIARQGFWTLDTAIWLLLRVEPGSLKLTIKEGNSKLPAPVVRVYTKALDAIGDETLKVPPGGPPVKTTAAHYRVHKRKFIAWAETAWGDTSHLTEALTAYDSLEVKPWQTDQDSQLAITRKVFVDVMDDLGWPGQKSLSHSALHRKMKKKAGPYTGIHGKTRSIELMNLWRNS